jgi:hypothetical protein
VLSRFGIEASPAIQYAIAFVIILGLVTLFGLVLRRLSSARLMLPGQDRGRSRQPRLGVVDIYDLDRQRQLILLRRDNVEHLLLIGGPNDVVIETNIVRVPPSRTAAPAAEAERPEEPAPPARPTIEPPARPALEAATARLGPALTRSEDSDAAQELSPVASLPPVPTPARTEAMLKPDAVTLAPQAPASDVMAPPPARPVPPARPEPMPERPTGVPVRPRVPEPPAPPARAPAAAPTPPAPTAAAPTSAAPAAPPRESRVPDEAILNDMARQLEAALRRPTPSAAATPSEQAPAAPAPKPPEPRREEPRREAPPPGPPLRATVAPEPPRPAPAAPNPSASAPTAPTPPRPAPAPEPPREPAAAAAPAAEPPPAAPATRNPDPFSVEDIEAEFARLLGRPSDKS